MYCFYLIFIHFISFYFILIYYVSFLSFFLQALVHSFTRFIIQHPRTSFFLPSQLFEALNFVYCLQQIIFFLNNSLNSYFSFPKLLILVINGFIGQMRAASAQNLLLFLFYFFCLMYTIGGL